MHDHVVCGPREQGIRESVDSRTGSSREQRQRTDRLGFRLDRHRYAEPAVLQQRLQHDLRLDDQPGANSRRDRPTGALLQYEGWAVIMLNHQLLTFDPNGYVMCSLSEVPETFNGGTPMKGGLLCLADVPPVDFLGGWSYAANGCACAIQGLNPVNGPIANDGRL